MQLTLHLQVSIEEAKSIIKRLLKKEGKPFKQRNMVVVLTGLMKSGKTTLLCRLFGKEPPKKYTSTGAAEKSWRGRSLKNHKLGVKSRQTIEYLDINGIFELVAPLLQNLLDDGGSDMKSTKLDQSKSGKVEDGKEKVAINVCSDKQVNVRPRSPSDDVHSINEMARRIPKESQDYTLEIVDMIDTGGQPESLELFPSLIHKSDLTLLVVNLAWGLDDYPLPTLHENDTKYEKRIPLNCNRQLIKQLAHTVQSCSSKSRILVIATHRDQVKTDLEKVKKDLNNLLREYLPEEMLVANKDGDNLYTVNLANPDETDNETLNAIRGNITAFSPEGIDMPPSLVLFEKEVLHHAEQVKKRELKVLNFEECLEIGKKLKLEEDDVRAALTYFHEHKIFLFYLNQLVFLEPRVLIDFVNKIVQLSYKVQSGEQITPGLTNAQLRQLNEGIITMELMCHNYFARTFIPKIFEAEHAIKIFQNLYTIAEVSAYPQSPEYIMMFLLPRLTQEEFEDKRKSLCKASSIKVMPLLLKFGRRCAPNGIFGNTVACLISKYKWKIHVSHYTSKPVYLKHDIVTLKPSEAHMKVTLVNNTNTFEVYIDPEDMEKRMFSAHVPQIRSHILEALNTAMETRNTDCSIVECFKCIHESHESSAIEICLPKHSSVKSVSCETCYQKQQMASTYTVWISNTQEGML